MQSTNSLRGVMLMTLSMAAFAVADALIKVATRDMPTGQLLILTGVIGTLCLFALARAQGAPVFDRSVLHRAVGIRCTAEVLGTAGVVTALSLAPLSLVSAILQCAPLFVTLGAALWLGERVGPRRWSAVALGLLGMLLILQPWGATLGIGVLAALFGTVMLSVRDVVTRQVPASISSATLAVYGFAATILSGALLLAIEPAWVPLTPRLMGFCVAIMAAAVCAYLAITMALRVGEVSAVAPFRYTRLVWALLIGWIFFGEVLTPLEALGAAIVVGSGVYVFWREARLKASPAP